MVLAGTSGRTYVGRYHDRGARGIVMHDVAVHDPATASLMREAWLERLKRFGIRVDHRSLVVDDREAGEISRLADLA